MALNRVDGPDNLFVGGVFALRRPGAMEAQGITSVLSMIKYSFVELPEVQPHCVHLSIDLDDVEDEDIIIHLPRAVRFIHRSLSGGTDDDKGQTPLPPSAEMKDLTLQGKPSVDPTKPGAVYVHCAMGKSRSVTAVVAYLLWKHPHRYGLNSNSNIRPDEETARRAVEAALEWVRKTREMAEPNPGFMSQLEMWVRMGRPADTDDAVQCNGTYQRWLWEREVEESAKLGRKPDWILFEDETDAPRSKDQAHVDAANAGAKELRCKKCRRVLATPQFIIPHERPVARGGGGPGKQPCPHHFVEALSWMKPVLEAGELDGRLVCPNPKCGSSIGRYAWQGFKCSCGEWVCPAFSLGASKVDEIASKIPGSSPGSGPGAEARSDSRAAAHGIRLPPGRQNL
ncbi:protein-tyrosine phosphatase-like protein [Coniella lustricola]|uniref:protein-tyrosine-phosphatase n=1 Tax=Coniella lustricola TaxID=2025994 RepID=A0A2T3ACT1_9PEZI|nr:protein-tyrosine phosphatase-like protein [Coniella lustricola]